jgi:6-phosphofructokinase 1
MIALRADGSTFVTPLDSVAKRERLLPPEYIAGSGNDVTPAFRDYAAPLVEPIPGYPVLF